ncbi:unnamed protein product [Symbiodinium natans]|uniref:Uncharacterized protein n=1 Tax=Symbiodinium natans TaxID=878477 RepID=A0A812UMT0_9DINO|nr:unnamed protein product [Symbiodinium natans]
MATPTLDGFGVLGGIAGSGSGTVPSLPVTPGGFPALLDAARQQTELVFWIVRTVQEHEGRISSLSRQLADQLKLLSEDRKIFKSASTRKWPSGGMGSRGLSRESFASNDGGVQSVLSQATGSPLHHESEAADKTQIEENLDMDLEHPDEPAEPAQPLEPAEPGDSESAEQGLEAGANGEAMAETEGASQSPDDRVEGSIASAEVRRMSFASGGRRRSSLTGPLPVDEATASNIVTEERLADRLEERIQQVLSQDVEARLEDVAQFVQEEIYRFVLGPQMMERVRHECSSVISMELAIALAAQDKKVEELIRSSLMGPLSHLESLPGQDVTDDLGRRLKLTEDLVGELKGLRLQVPDMRNELTNLQSSLMATVHTVEELEVRQEELAAAGAHRLSPVSPHRSSPSRAEAIDDEGEGLGVDDLGEAVGETGADGGSPTNAPSPAPQSRQPSRPPSRQPSRQPSVVASPDDMKPKRRLSDMLGLYMAPAAKPQAADDSQVQELAARTESMRTRLEQMEQIVGTEQAAVTSRRHSLQNKLNDVDTLAAILEDRMRELDMDFRASKQHGISSSSSLLFQSPTCFS